MGIKDGGPAFVVNSGMGSTGMTLRDWFSSTADDRTIARESVAYRIEFKKECSIPEARYYYADRMLKEREK